MGMLSHTSSAGKQNLFGAEQKKGNWELDLKQNNLSWSPEQFSLYGYEPNELILNDEYFIINTTHPSDIERITATINEALRKSDGYAFKRRIIKKNGSLGFVETQAKIIRSKNGIPEKIIGTTSDIGGHSENGFYDYSDPLFFKMFYSKYKKAITAEIYKWTYNNTLSKDLCQEIFLKAWHNMSKYDATKGELYTWLINIARNHCKDYLRSKYFRYHQLTQNYDCAPEPAYEETVSDFENKQVKELILRLPLDQREIIELLFIQGFTQTEVATMKQLPLGTVKSRSRIALKFLRDILLAPQNAMLKEELSFC
ncbi:hypothetical protein CNR22_00570 [Sphingobacteriaceae bacterium]|nr:hypothetical protein CNR22_00570 [Sphingobacteriaceae bacterium]